MLIQAVRINTKQPNKRAAETLEADHRTRLARGDAGIRDRSAIPTLAKFEEQFMKFVEVHSAEKPKTIAFYRDRIARLIEFEPLAATKLDRIDEELIEVLCRVTVRRQHEPQSIARLQP